MAEHSGGGAFHVVWSDVIAIRKCSQGFTRVQQAQRTAEAGPVLDLGQVARGATDGDQVLHHRVVNLGGSDLCTQVQDAGRVDDRLQTSRNQVSYLEAGVVSLDDAFFGVGGAVIHQNFEEESIELRLGQWVGPFE